MQIGWPLFLQRLGVIVQVSSECAYLQIFCKIQRCFGMLILSEFTR